MISICAVFTTQMMQELLPVFVHTITTKTTHVNEVIIVKADEVKESTDYWFSKHILFRLFRLPLFGRQQAVPWEHAVCAHAWGLHRAIERSRNDYLWFTDGDVFFLSEVDEFYLSLVEQHGLNIVGVSHFNPTDQCYSYFPCVINCLLRKQDLPAKDWLGGDFYAQSTMRAWGENPGKVVSAGSDFLIPCPLPDYWRQFPNPKGIFDAGCNLWLWNEERKGRWLSFYLHERLDAFKGNMGCKDLVYPLNYNARHYRNNFGFTGDLGDHDLLYHRTRGAKENGSSYRALYESLFGKLEVESYGKGQVDRVSKIRFL